MKRLDKVIGNVFQNDKKLKVKCIDCEVLYEYDSDDIFPFALSGNQDNLISGICRKCSSDKAKEYLKGE